MKLPPNESEASMVSESQPPTAVGENTTGSCYDLRFWRGRESSDKIKCNVTPVILHGVVSPVILNGGVFPEGGGWAKLLVRFQFWTGLSRGGLGREGWGARVYIMVSGLGLPSRSQD
jgi:hypothetical protein